MRFVILGTRGHIKASAPGHTKHSGVLLDDRILFDVGQRDYLDLGPEIIFLTHLHSDHAFFMEDDDPPRNIPIFAPEEIPWLPNLQRILDPIVTGPYRISPIPTYHSKEVRSNAYLIEDEQRRVLYTGDIISIHGKHRKRLRDLDLVITEGSFMRRDGLVRRDPRTNKIFGHTGIPNLVSFFSRYTDHIVITHFGSWFFKDIEESTKRIEALGDGAKVEVAYDGMVVEI